MFPFFTKKYIKIPVVALVIVSLLLQFVPQPVKAWNPIDALKKIFATIEIPNEIELTDEGGIKFGTYLEFFDCFFKQQPEASGNSVDLKFCGCNGLDCGWRNNDTCRKDKATCPAGDVECLADSCDNSPGCGDGGTPCCVDESNDEQCINPFSTFRFGHHESQVDLMKDGKLAIPEPKIPSRCQLKIPLPDDDDTMSIEEKLAERKACNYFRRVQQSAAQIAYTAKKIFNNTDPLSECFFLKNCKTSCTLRFGKVKYVITLIDIIRLFVGDYTVVLSMVQKIVNLIRIFQNLMEIAKTFEDLLKQGVGIISELLNAVKDVYTLGSSLENLGLDISDAFLFSIPSIVTGNMQDKVKKGYNGFVRIISNFAGNLEKYQLAKSETLALTEQTKEDIKQVMEEPAEVNMAPGESVEVAGFKNEPEVGFLFVKKNTAETRDNYEKKMQVDKIIADFQAMFKPISSLVDRMALLGELFDGSSVGYRKPASELPTGLGSCADLCITNQLTACRDCIANEGVTEGNVIDDGFDDLLSYSNPLTIKAIVDEYNLDTNLLTCPKLCLFKKPYPNDPEVFDFRATPRNANYQINLNSYLLNPIYIRGVIEAALADEEGANGKLDYPKALWRTYWEHVTDAIDEAGKSAAEILNGKNMQNGHNAMINHVINPARGQFAVAMSKIAMLDISRANTIGCGSKITTACIEKQINEYKGILSGEYINNQFGGGPTSETGPWFDNFKQVARDINNLKAYVGLIKPDYIQKVIDAALGGYNKNSLGEFTEYAYKVLDHTKAGWRVYWEQLGRAVLKQGTVDYILKNHKDPATKNELESMEDRHKFIVEQVWKTLNPATDALWFRTIAELDENIDGLQGVSCGAYNGGDPCDENNCDKCDKPEQIKNIISKYKSDMEAHAPVRYDLIAKVAGISQYISSLVQQKQYLIDNDPNNSATPDKLDRYWEVTAWCTTGSFCPIAEAFNQSYYPDLPEVNNWGDRIDFLENSKGDVDIIVNALSYQLSPLEPLLIYYIDRAKEKLIEYSLVFEEALEDAKKEADEEIANYCAADMSTPAYAKYREYLHYYNCYKDGSNIYPDDGLNCSSSNLPVKPMCEDWIGSCNNCDDCKENCEDNCIGPCDRYTYEYCYICYLDAGIGGKYCDEDQGDASGDCANNCPSDDGGYCSSDHDKRYDCLLTASEETYKDEDDCEAFCKPDECSTKQNCKNNFCSKEDEGSCWLENYYEDESIKELARVNAECARRKAYEKYLDGNALNIKFGPIILNFETVFDDLKLAIKNLQNIWEEKVIADRESAIAYSIVNRIIDSIDQALVILSPILPDVEEALAGLSGLNKAEEYLNLGFCGEDSLGSCTTELGDDYRCPEGVYNNTCNREKVSESAWKMFLLIDNDNPENSGVIIKFRQAIDKAYQRIINFIKIKIGYDSINKYPMLDSSGIIHDINGCPDEYVGGLFLNKIRCFEKENKRMFEHLPHFIAVVAALENMGFAMDQMEDNIIDLEPRLDLEVLDLNPDESLEEAADMFKFWDNDKEKGFTIGGEKITSVQALKDKISQNPIVLLNNTFEAIKEIFGYIYDQHVSLSLNTGDYLHTAFIRIDDWEVFDRTMPIEDAKRRDAYQKAIENLRDENMTDLRELIFKQESITEGCTALSLILNSNPQDTRNNCSDIDGSLIGSAIDDFDEPLYPASPNGCRELSLVDLTLFERDKADELEALTAERDALVEFRENVKEIRCDDSSRDTDISCPEWICEGVADPYCVAAPASSKKDGAVWDSGTLAGDRVWPPPDPCDGNGYAVGYLGAQAECIRTQKELQKYEAILGPDISNEFKWVTKELIDSCDQLEIQKSLKKECEHFEMLENNVFPDNCGWLSGLSGCSDDAYLRGYVVPPCKGYCEFLRDKIKGSFCSEILDCSGGIPNLTLPSDSVSDEELTFLVENRITVIEKCELAAHNIQGPLEEVMNIFAILLGIKSATGLYSGVQVLKSSTQKIIRDVTKFVFMIKGDGTKENPGIIGELIKIWEQVDEEFVGDGGLKVEAVRCESHPAVSYTTSKDEKLTSNQGGPVCRGITDLFQQIEGQFGLVRQNVRNIDLARKGVKEGGFSIGSLQLHLWDEYPVIYESFDDIYQAADNIKTSASYVWALANAVNFANKQCSCGESYCKMPLCVSGLPLAFAPVKNPYCYLTWIFRFPMESVAKRLGELLEQQIK